MSQNEPLRARYPDEEGFVERDGVRVGYELYEGPEPTVLFAPQPALGHARGLKNVIPYIARHFRLLLVEGRGNGRSDRPADPAAYTPPELTADCLAALDATETQRAIVVSWSPLASVGLNLCVDHADRVIAAVFVTPNLWLGDGFTAHFNARREAYTDAQAYNRHHMLADWPGFVKQYVRVLLPHPHSTRQMEEVVSHALDTDGPSFVASVDGRSLPEREAALAMARRVRCPILIMQNGGSALGSKDSSNALAEVTGARLHVFEDLGPIVWCRWPVLFNIALREFLESVRAGEAEAQSPSAARASRAGAGMPPVSAA
jgi:pimeloyl-ACP methyl ester carboxylesterase